MKYCGLPFMLFVVVAPDSAVCYQCSEPSPFHSYLRVLVPLAAHLRTRVQNYGFFHFIDRSAFDYASAHVMFQRSDEVHRTSCGTDDWWYYYIIELGSVRDVPTGVFETREWDYSCRLITGHTLPFYEISWDVPARRCVTFEKMRR